MGFLLSVTLIPLSFLVITFWWLFKNAKKNGSYQHCGRASYMGY